MDLETLSYVLKRKWCVILKYTLFNRRELEATRRRRENIELTFDLEIFRPQLERRSEELRRIEGRVHCSLDTEHNESHQIEVLMREMNSGCSLGYHTVLRHSLSLHWLD